MMKDASGGKMICSICGQDVESKFKFCDSCGAEIITPHGAKPEKSRKASNAAENASKTSDSAFPAEASLGLSRSLTLTSWAGLRWLVATEYGSLSITETHLNHQIDKLWASNVYSVLVKIFSWGFDPFSSFAIGRGATNLKSISTVRILAIDWVIWKGHFVFIWAGGLPDIYLFSSHQLPEVAAFVESLKRASGNFKYPTSK